MRLIDLDKVRWKEGFFDMHTGEQYASMMFNTPEWLEWATAEAQVKAIPIEWMYLWRIRNMDKCPVNLMPFDVMLEDWEKENGK